MAMDTKIDHLVVDSGAFITGFDIVNKAKNLYSVEGVLGEIKDNSTLERVRCLPMALVLKEAPSEDLKLVIEFSKKTGDYGSLSAVDIQVLALTCYLQRVHVSTDHVGREPRAAKVVTSSSDIRKASSTSLAGFYTPKKATQDSGDEDDSWITPENLETVKSKMMGIKLEDGKKETQVVVACVTTDYAMQNVLLQLGIPILSAADGRVIKRTKQFVLRCFACFKTTEDMSRKFCPKCGNLDTLKRVSVTTDQKGNRRIFINYKKAINVRGTRYSLPLPKGGKHSSDPVLVEDQRIPHNRPSKFAVGEQKMASAALKNVDYVARSNPFAVIDVYSRASRHVKIHHGSTPKARNPNAVRKGTGSRKKKKCP